MIEPRTDPLTLLFAVLILTLPWAAWILGQWLEEHYE